MSDRDECYGKKGKGGSVKVREQIYDVGKSGLKWTSTDSGESGHEGIGITLERGPIIFIMNELRGP